MVLHSMLPTLSNFTLNRRYYYYLLQNEPGTYITLHYISVTLVSNMFIFGTPAERINATLSFTSSFFDIDKDPQKKKPHQKWPN